jgi:iron only hydrogenase large subunit-like protein
MGVKAVYDTSSSRDLALIEACNEFVSRYQLNQLSGDKEAGASLPVLSSACPGKKNVCWKYSLLFPLCNLLYK